MSVPAAPLPPPLYLASASPRRLELLRRAGLEPVVVPSNAPEARRAGETARALVLRLARAKAEAVRRLLRSRGAKRGVVLAADTVVESGGRILGKPGSAARAKAMLRSLSGRVHRVHTGVCLGLLDGEVSRSGFSSLSRPVVRVQPGSRSRAQARTLAFVETARVFFRKLSESEIAAYVATGEPLDKAGAYGIQGAAGSFVRRVEGDYHAVMGLPLARVVEALARLEAP